MNSEVHTFVSDDRRRTTDDGSSFRPLSSVFCRLKGGFPHSEIRGSKFVRNSPRLIAAYHVLHRLSAPRHPPDALKALDCSHRRCPPLGRGSFARTIPRSSKTESTHSFFLCSEKRPACFANHPGMWVSIAPRREGSGDKLSIRSDCSARMSR